VDGGGDGSGGGGPDVVVFEHRHCAVLMSVFEFYVGGLQTRRERGKEEVREGKGGKDGGP